MPRVVVRVMWWRVRKTAAALVDRIEVWDWGVVEVDALERARRQSPVGPLIHASAVVVVVVVVVKEGGVLKAYHPVTSCYDGWPLLGRSWRERERERERERGQQKGVGGREGERLCCACCSAVLMLPDTCTGPSGWSTHQPSARARGSSPLTSPHTPLRGSDRRWRYLGSVYTHAAGALRSRRAARRSLSSRVTSRWWRSTPAHRHTRSER